MTIRKIKEFYNVDTSGVHNEKKKNIRNWNRPWIFNQRGHFGNYKTGNNCITCGANLAHTAFASKIIIMRKHIAFS